ncbi:unnamed protein product [Miscanthus lutarioriparius]|uniref:Uncharacterized protein n=1 Tax=Miscanthus lutarioriparius TaxID=422564 RepID=A0A811QW16_9POAL|nr:unnamed protein product [Miscanthus lutarioriparius]
MALVTLASLLTLSGSDHSRLLVQTCSDPKGQRANLAKPQSLGMGLPVILHHKKTTGCFRPYHNVATLADAAAHLHSELSASVPLVRRWVPSPPPRARVDAALRAAGLEDEAELSRLQFREFAVELFREAVLAGAADLLRAPATAAGVVGIGMVARAGPLVVGRVVAVCAAGVATAVYLSLG